MNSSNETSELMVTSQVGQIIRLDTKSIRAAGRRPEASNSSTSNQGQKWLPHFD